MLKPVNKIISYFCITWLICIAINGCSKPRTHLDRIKERGELHVVTRHGPATYYFVENGASGLEYELARRFADQLDVKLKIIVAKNTAEIVDIITTGKADLAASSFISNYREEIPLLFGPNYQWIIQQVVYRNGQPRPLSLDELSPEPLHLSDGILHPNNMEQLQKVHPNLSWQIHADKNVYDLLELVEKKEILYTIANSNTLALAQQFYPEVRAAFNISSPQPVAWVFRKTDDHSLLNAAKEFYIRLSDNGELSQLINFFQNSREYFDYVDSRKFIDRFYKRLPRIKSYFEQAALQYEVDWRLLAAVSYQESHWNDKAMSPTGVRGLMMLTLNTARSVNVTNRLDPEQSILGGTRYLKQLINKIPERIKEPDRTWFALAAYNVGLGHLNDARILTEKAGANPDSWLDVKQKLPLLSMKKWYIQTEYGYARGSEPVKFVEKVRKYYYVLVQLTQPEAHPNPQLVDIIQIDPPVL